MASLQKEFMKQVQTSGVLMVFSQAWIEELYHQVLDRNMLGEAGYWGAALRTTTSPSSPCSPVSG